MNHKQRIAISTMNKTRKRGFRRQAGAIRFEPDPVIEAYKKDIDRTLIRENLKLTAEQRLLKLTELQRFALELRRAGKSAADRT